MLPYGTKGIKYLRRNTLYIFVQSSLRASPQPWLLEALEAAFFAANSSLPGQIPPIITSSS